MRTVPKSGYDIGAKRQYRRDVWSFFDKHSLVPRHQAKVLCLPSLEGDEVEVILSKGFKEQNIHIVDRNPAIVATLKRRYPRINTYGIDLFGLSFPGSRLSNHSIDLANLDLCDSISAGWALTCMQFAYHKLAPTGLISATYLKGRDPATIRILEFIQNNFPSYACSRDELAGKFLGFDLNYKRRTGKDYHPFLATRHGEYNSSSPMGWVAGRSWLSLPSAEPFYLGPPDIAFTSLLDTRHNRARRIASLWNKCVLFSEKLNDAKKKGWSPHFLLGENYLAQSSKRGATALGSNTFIKGQIQLKRSMSKLSNEEQDALRRVHDQLSYENVPVVQVIHTRVDRLTRSSDERVIVSTHNATTHNA